MSLRAAASGPPARGPGWPWPACLLAVLALHSAALLLLRDRRPAFEAPPPPEAIMLELTPTPPDVSQPAFAAPPTPTVAPSAPPSEAEAPARPVEVPEPAPLPPAVQPAEAAAAILPPPRPAPVTRPSPPRPVVRRPPPHVAPSNPPPRAASVVPANPAPAAALPTPAASAPSSAATATANWPGLLAAHLARFRHYPAEAERRGFTGVAMMRFSVDASGRVVSASLARGSGHDILDEEAALWLKRAQPLPPPPPDRAAPAQILLPLSFVLH